MCHVACTIVRFPNSLDITTSLENLTSFSLVTTCHCQADLTLLVQCLTGLHLRRTEFFDQFPNYWTASRLKSLSTLVTPLATRWQNKAIATAATTDARHNDSSSIGDCRRHCGSSWAFELLPPVGNCCHHQLSWKIWTAAVHWLLRTAAGPRQIHFHNFNKYSFSIEQMLHSTDWPHLLIHSLFFPIKSCT